MFLRAKLAENVPDDGEYVEGKKEVSGGKFKGGDRRLCEAVNIFMYSDGDVLTE